MNRGICYGGPLDGKMIEHGIIYGYEWVADPYTPNGGFWKFIAPGKLAVSVVQPLKRGPIR